MAAEDSGGQVLAAFEEVAVYFSLEEWALLTAGQRTLYQEVMEDNFELVASLGSQRPPKPELLCRMEQGEQPYAVDLPGQGGTPVSAARSPSMQDPAVKAEEFSGRWSPLVSPESTATGADVGFLNVYPSSGSELKPPDVESASPGPWDWEGGRGCLGVGSLDRVEWQICECGRSFEDSESLRQHQSLHREENGPFVCPSCGKLFRYHLNLLTHKKHRGKKLHACAQCGIQFCLKGDLLHHRASHAAEGLRPCGVCGLLFRHKRHLLVHSAEHGRDTAHQSGTAFGGQAELTGCPLSPPEERPFLCAHCGKSFSWKESLQVHQRTHAQDRGHSCHVCGKTFSRHGNLLTHQRLHTGELPFPCPECDRSFPSKVSLMAHSRHHQRGRSFGCPQSSRPFGSRDKLLEHQAGHGTEEQPMKQEVEL